MGPLQEMAMRQSLKAGEEIPLSMIFPPLVWQPLEQAKIRTIRDLVFYYPEIGHELSKLLDFDSARDGDLVLNIIVRPELAKFGLTTPMTNADFREAIESL